MAVSSTLSHGELKSERITIRVKTKGDSKDKFVGKASFPASRLADKFNRIVEVKGVLMNKEGDEECGKYCLRGRFRNESFDDAGFLDVSVVEAKDMESKGLSNI